MQAAIDGLVLLAMNSGDWMRLAARSSNPSCDAPFESLRRASLALSSRFQTESTFHLPGATSVNAIPGHDDADRPKKRREGDGDDDHDCEEAKGEDITKIIPSPPGESGEVVMTPPGIGEKGSEAVVGV